MILISILLAKSTLSTESIAVYELLLFIGTAVSFFWINGLLDGILPVYPKLSEAEQGPFLFSVFLQFCGISLGIFVLLYFGKAFILPLLIKADQIPFYESYCWFLLFNLPATLIEYIYLLRQKARWIVVFGFLSFGLQLLAVILPVFWGLGLEVSIWALAILAALRFLWLLVVVFQYGSFSWRPDLLQSYILLALPLMGYAFIGGFAQLFDSWLVNWYYTDDTQFAIFRYGARELPLATALVGGIYTAMVPEVATNLAGALAKIKAASRRIYHWLFPLAILLLLTSNQFFPLVFSEAFQESAMVFNIYLLLLISRVLLPYTILMGLRETKIILGVSILEMVVNIVLSIVLVPYWGLEGIAIATVIAFLLEKVTLSLYLNLKYGVPWQKYTDVPLFVLYSSVLTGAFVFVRFVLN